MFMQAAYLFGWLLLLRIEEVIRLNFESIDVVPGERMYSMPILYACSKLTC